MESTVTYNVFHLLYWDWRIAGDLFFGGVGIGAFIYAVLLGMKARQSAPSLLQQSAAVLAPIGMVVGLLLLMTELGHPLRAWKTVLQFRVTSPLSWGAVLQGLFLAVAISYAGLVVREARGCSEHKGLRVFLGCIGVPLAIAVGTYHGFLLSIVKSFPFWNTGFTVASAVLAFITTGIAAVVLVGALIPSLRKELSQAFFTLPLLAAALLLQLATFALHWLSLYFGASREVAAISYINEEYGSLFWVGAVVLGIVVPSVGLVSVWGKTQAGLSGNIGAEESRTAPVPSAVVPAVCAALILVGGAIFRYVWVLAGQLY